MDTAERNSIEMVAIQSVVKALVATHPNPEVLRLVCDQLTAQAAASPYYMGDLKKMHVLKASVDAILNPPPLNPA